MFTKFDFNTILFVIKKRRDLCIIEPSYGIREVFHANEKVGERLYPSVALEGKKIDRWLNWELNIF